MIPHWQIHLILGKLMEQHVFKKPSSDIYERQLYNIEKEG